VRRGLPLEGGGAWLLTRSISLARAKELALYGEPLPAREAERWGLINRCVPAAELEATTREWAHKLATLRAPGSGPPVAGAPDLSGEWATSRVSSTPPGSRPCSRASSRR
jgi:2-(1,2-epoxy-1,2-dihydrophenyl)acetyl-CoA isomerase